MSRTRLGAAQAHLRLAADALEVLANQHPRHATKFDQDADDLRVFVRHLDERAGLIGGAP